MSSAARLGLGCAAVALALIMAVNTAIELGGWPSPWADALSLGSSGLVLLGLRRLLPTRCRHCGDDLDGGYRHRRNYDGTCRVVLR